MVSLLRGAGFITGGASGIGRATAFSFARHGARQLALVDIDLSAARNTAREIESQFPGVQAIAHEIDVASESSVNEAVKTATKQLGRIDYAVNSAGIGGPSAPSGEHDVADWTKTINIDLNGVWMSSRAEIRQMLQQEKLENSPRHNRGVIINVASMYGIIATPANIPVVSYTAAKHGVIGLTRADAIAYAPGDIRINAICPGYVLTPLIRAAMESGALETERAKIPVRRLATMDEIADHITFLASPMSSFMYGSSVVADGGYTIQ